MTYHLIVLSLDYIIRYGVPNVDYHIHSVYSDGKSTVEEIIDYAERKGLLEIAITDHVWKTSTWVDKYVTEIKKLRKDRIVRVYVGLEAKAINFAGELDITREQRDKIEMLIGVVHRYPVPSFEDYKFLDAKTLTWQRAAEIETEVAINIIKSARPDVLGHPARTYYKFVYPRERREFPEELFYEIVRAAKRHNVILEYNSRWSRPWMLEILFSENAPFVLGSDAHIVNEIGSIDRAEVYMVAQQYMGV